MGLGAIYDRTWLFPTLSARTEEICILGLFAIWYEVRFALTLPKTDMRHVQLLTKTQEGHGQRSARISDSVQDKLCRRYHTAKTHAAHAFLLLQILQ